VLYYGDIMAKYSENRSGSRESIHQPVSFDLSGIESGRLRNIQKSGLGVDISSGGMGLTTDFQLHAGDVLKLYFPVAGHASLPVFTEVIWSRPADGEFRVGLRFLA
jgi:hypothetical protein